MASGSDGVLQRPVGHWNRLRTTGGPERLHREIDWRIRAAGASPDRARALRLIAAVARKVTAILSDRQYVDVSLLEKREANEAA